LLPIVGSLSRSSSMVGMKAVSKTSAFAPE
jgi:hypothetical protein